MAIFKGLLVKNIYCDVRGGYEEADVKINQILIDLQKSSAEIVKIQIVSFDKSYAVFTIMYNGSTELDYEDDEQSYIPTTEHPTKNGPSATDIAQDKERVKRQKQIKEE